MTFVDDSLLGTASIRSAKSGGKQKEADAANQRSAFENAFADAAGKEKQPVISIREKTVADTGTQATVAASQALNVATDIDAVSNDAAAAVDQDGSSSLPGSTGDGEVKSALASANAALRAAAKQMLTPQSGEEPAVEQEAPGRQFTLAPSEGKARLLASIGLANLGADATAGAGETLDEQAGEKLKGLLKDPKAQLSKRSDDKATPSDEALQANSSNNADAAMDAAPSDVSHLLALLGVTQEQTDAGTTSVPSEFQALAESAGKAKAAAYKDAAAAEAPVRSEADADAAQDATQAGSDRLFRFARAGGKGPVLSMNVASDENKAGAAPTTTAKTETVTVVEARRYLGLAPTSNASAITSQIVGNPEWVDAFQQSTEASTGKVLNTLKIQMHPIDLGTVTATLRLKDDGLQVELKVETGDAFRQLSDDQDAMVKALRAQGFAVDQVSVVFNSSDGSSGNNPQQQAQSQAGQQGREAGDGPAQGRGQSNDGGSREQGGGRWTGNEGTSDASSGAEPGRTGDVYM